MLVYPFFTVIKKKNDFLCIQTSYGFYIVELHKRSWFIWACTMLIHCIPSKYFSFALTNNKISLLLHNIHINYKCSNKIKKCNFLFLEDKNKQCFTRQYHFTDKNNLTIWQNDFNLYLKLSILLWSTLVLNIIFKNI